MGNLAVNIKNADLFIGEKQVLFDINWQIEQGEHWFILGSNGAGKTTLTRMLLGYIWPRYGAEISVLGETFGKCDLCQLRKKLTWISPYLVSWTSNSKWTVQKVIISGVDSTIGLYRKPTTEELSKSEELLNSLDFDSENIKNKPFGNLSSGEQVKVLIARALMSEPEIMVLDEACVHLDLKAREHLLDVIEKFTSQKNSPTIIFITQRIEDVIPIFSKGITLKNGRITASGNREDIITESNINDLFDLDVELVKTGNGRYWPIVK